MTGRQSNITKSAYVRGIGQYLQERGAVKFADEEMLRYACDKVASEFLATEPIKLAADGQAYQYDPTFDEVTAVAETLVKMSQYLESQGKTAADASSVRFSTPESAYGDLIRKVAASALIDSGGTPPNTLSDAAASDNIAAIENKRRPQGYANVAPGGANFSEDAASRIGKEQKQVDLDTVANPSTTNSVIKATKAGSVLESLRKLSNTMGALVTEDDPAQQNKLELSTDNVAQMEAAQRPEGYANVGAGNANIGEVEAARVGVEQPHPKQPVGVEGAATNSVIEATKAAEVQNLANILMPLLPTTMSPEEKIATVQRTAEIQPALREHYVREVLAGRR